MRNNLAPVFIEATVMLAPVLSRIATLGRIDYLRQSAQTASLHLKFYSKVGRGGSGARLGAGPFPPEQRRNVIIGMQDAIWRLIIAVALNDTIPAATIGTKIAIG